MENLLKITDLTDTLPHTSFFERWFTKRTESIFYANQPKELAPAGYLLTESGKIITASVDFRDERRKKVSMLQMRVLAHFVKCTAYGFVSEGHIKEYTDVNKEEVEDFIKKANGRISKLPDSREVLLRYMEIREGAEIKYTQTLQDIIRENGGVGTLKSVITISNPHELIGTVVKILL